MQLSREAVEALQELRNESAESFVKGSDNVLGNKRGDALTHQRKYKMKEKDALKKISTELEALQREGQDVDMRNLKISNP